MKERYLVGAVGGRMVRVERIEVRIEVWLIGSGLGKVGIERRRVRERF